MAPKNSIPWNPLIGARATGASWKLPARLSTQERKLYSTGIRQLCEFSSRDQHHNGSTLHYPYFIGNDVMGVAECAHWLHRFPAISNYWLGVKRPSFTPRLLPLPDSPGTRVGLWGCGHTLGRTLCGSHCWDHSTLISTWSQSRSDPTRKNNSNLARYLIVKQTFEINRLTQVCRHRVIFELLRCVPGSAPLAVRHTTFFIVLKNCQDEVRRGTSCGARLPNGVSLAGFIPHSSRTGPCSSRLGTKVVPRYFYLKSQIKSKLFCSNLLLLFS